jgi:DNA-binding NtrC family response regulator
MSLLRGFGRRRAVQMSEPLGAKLFDLTGVRILLVEDSWNVGVAVKSLLRAFGADVSGPVATAAEAEQLIAQQIPDVGIVDFNLRGGELALDLIDSMNMQGIRVIVLFGYSNLPLLPGQAANVLKSRSSKPSLLRLCARQLVR